MTTDVTQLISRAVRRDPHAASEFVQLTYEELRRLAARFLERERRDHTLQPTALVHEAYLRLVGPERIDWQGRTHFLRIAAREMRRVLAEHARRHNSLKRGHGRARVLFEESLFPTQGKGVDTLDLEEAFDELSTLHERQARLVELRFFAGLTVAESAGALGVSAKTAEKDWRTARAWLYQRLDGGASP